jgi:hypothetical protein
VDSQVKAGVRVRASSRIILVITLDISDLINHLEILLSAGSDTGGMGWA